MRSSPVFAFLQLTRPANVITAIADIWAGFAIAGGWTYMLSNWELGTGDFWQKLAWLSLSTIGLYAGGVAFNDVFDSELDAKERPERPIPSGRVSRNAAAWMSTILLILGILAASQVNVVSFGLAILVAILAVTYDYWGKHQFYFGPINMGMCRAGNLLLGISVAPELIHSHMSLIGLIPLIYVAAITMISRGEVHGKNRNALFGGAAMYGIIILSIFMLSYINGPTYLETIPFLIGLGIMIFPPLLKAIRTQDPKLIGKSVKAAVISLIILNASLAAAFAGWKIGVFVLLLLPVSLWLARKFAVT